MLMQESLITYCSSPEILLDIGARLIKTEKELILKSRWVLPERLLQQGFELKSSTIGHALRDIFQNKKDN